VVRGRLAAKASSQKSKAAGGVTRDPSPAIKRKLSSVSQMASTAGCFSFLSTEIA